MTVREFLPWRFRIRAARDSTPLSAALLLCSQFRCLYYGFVAIQISLHLGLRCRHGAGGRLAQEVSDARFGTMPIGRGDMLLASQRLIGLNI